MTTLGLGTWSHHIPCSGQIRNEKSEVIVDSSSGACANGRLVWEGTLSIGRLSTAFERSNSDGWQIIFCQKHVLRNPISVTVRSRSSENEASVWLHARLASETTTERRKETKNNPEPPTCRCDQARLSSSSDSDPSR
jgi:hypothetical protein